MAFSRRTRSRSRSSRRDKSSESASHSSGRGCPRSLAFGDRGGRPHPPNGLTKTRTQICESRVRARFQSCRIDSASLVSGHDFSRAEPSLRASCQGTISVVPNRFYESCVRARLQSCRTNLGLTSALAAERGRPGDRVEGPAFAFRLVSGHDFSRAEPSLRALCQGTTSVVPNRFYESCVRARLQSCRTNLGLTSALAAEGGPSRDLTTSRSRPTCRFRFATFSRFKKAEP
jgi:hypothetical protein